MKSLILDPRILVVERFEDVADWLYNRHPEGVSIFDIAEAIGWDPDVFFETVQKPKNASRKTREDLGLAIVRIAEFLGVHVNTILRHRRQPIASPTETFSVDLNPSVSLD